MKTKKTLVLGASEKIERYSNKAVRLLQEFGYPVYAVGNREGEINGTKINTELPSDEQIHTVSLYISEKNQKVYYDKIIKLQPKRVIFNPGTENDEFEKLLNENNIETEEACTLVLLHTKAF